MNLEILLSSEYIIYTISGVVIIFFILRYFIKKKWLQIKTKRFVKQSKKRRNKHFNGIKLVEKTKTKRKKNTNTFKKLRRSSKKHVTKYLQYKSQEIPKILNVAANDSLKSSKSVLYIIFKNEKKVLSKVAIELSYKPLINNSNTYECLDEIILFLHHLPDALLEKKDYDVFIQDKNMLITYEIK